MENAWSPLWDLSPHSWSTLLSSAADPGQTHTAKTTRKGPSDRRNLGLVSASSRCWSFSVPHNVWIGETQLYMYVKWWWNAGRVLQWAVLHPSGNSGKKIPAVFMTSATHTGILIAVSLLWGEEIDYLKASPTPAYFHMPFPSPSCVQSFLSFLLVSLVCHSSWFFFAPSCCIMFPPYPTSRECIEKDATEFAFLCGRVNQQRFTMVNSKTCKGER